MKKILLLGGGHAEIPLICAAKKMGYYVITTGNQADGMGHPYGDAYDPCDFSDKEAVLQLASRHKVEAICSGCNDFAYLSAAYACQQLGLPGHDSYETALEIHHKDKYRALAQHLQIKTPKAVKCFNAEEVLAATEGMQFPVIVKPVDLTGGKGVRRCDYIWQLEEAYQYACNMTRERYVIVEEFIVGSNHGFTAFIQKEKVTFWFADNEQYYHNPYLVSGASTPGDIPEKAIRQLCTDAERIAGNLHLQDGILHIQFILNRMDEPVIIEVCRRAPGDLYVHLVRLADDFDYAHYIVAAEAGISQPKPIYHNPEGFWVRHCIMADTEGTIEDVCFSDAISPYVVQQLLWYRKGENIEDAMKYKAGIVFLHFREEKTYRYFLSRMTEEIKIQLQ